MWKAKSNCVVLGNVSLHLCAQLGTVREGHGQNLVPQRHFLRHPASTIVVGFSSQVLAARS